MYYSFWRSSYSEELYHFGVLGMKWGVRRFQNKDGTLTPKGKQRIQEIYEKRKAGIEEQRRTALADASKAKQKAGITEEKDYDVIAKGTSLNRFTTNKSEDQAKAAYVSATWDDKIAYENDALEGLLGIAAPSNDWLNIELEAVSDLKVARGKEIVDYILSNREASREAADYLSNVEQHHAILEALYDEKNASIHEKSKHKIDEALFNTYDKGRIEARSLIVNSLYENKDFRDKMFDHFKKKGYAAIEDIEDSNYMQNGRATPMIIIDPSSSVKVKQVYQVFDPETGDAYRPIKHSTETPWSARSSELYHFGIKGMKWGIRKDRKGQGFSKHSPAIDHGSYVEYPKGTTLGRYGEYDPNYPVYLYTNKTDRDFYSEQFGGNEYTLTTVKSIKRPSYEEQVKQLYLYTKDREAIEDPYYYWKENINQGGYLAEGYFEHMKSLGYSALLDVRNYGLTEDPILLIDNSAVEKRK